MDRFLGERILELLTSYNYKNLGLFTGKTGVCLALYSLAKGFGVAEAENAADSLVEEIAAELPRARSTSFDKGLAGIGWAVNLLNEAGCITGKIDEILCDVDAAIYKTLTCKSYNIPLYCTSGLVGYLAYLSCRLGNPNHRKNGDLNRLCTAALRITIDKIQNIMPSAFSVMSKDLYITALWEFPLLFVLLRKALELGVYSH